MALRGFDHLNTLIRTVNYNIYMQHFQACVCLCVCFCDIWKMNKLQGNSFRGDIFLLQPFDSFRLGRLAAAQQLSAVLLLLVNTTKVLI